MLARQTYRLLSLNDQTTHFSFDHENAKQKLKQNDLGLCLATTSTLRYAKLKLSCKPRRRAFI